MWSNLACQLTLCFGYAKFSERAFSVETGPAIAGISRGKRDASGNAEDALRMAARLGVEPRQSESESLVLPLHNRAVDTDYCWDGARVGGNIDTVDRKMEPAMGFEPATACLQNRCSTVELRRRTRPEPGSIVKNDDPKAGGSPGTRTPNLLIKSQLLYH